MKTPRCKCGKVCQYYGRVGGYSVACEDCNENNAKRQREARAKKRRTDSSDSQTEPRP